MKDKLASIRTENLMVNGKTIDNDITLNKTSNILIYCFLSSSPCMVYFGSLVLKGGGACN